MDVKAIVERNKKDEEDHAFARTWLRVLSGALVMMLTFGNILSFGLFTENLEQTMNVNPLESDVAFLGESQLVFFFVSGAILGGLHWSLYIVFGAKPQTRDRVIGITGCLLWAAGYGGSVALVRDYVAFGGLFMTCGGIGAGLMYWNVWIMLPTWVPPRAFPNAFPAAVFALSAAPNLGVTLLSYLLIGIDALCQGDSRWYCTYLGLSIASGAVLLGCAIFLVSTPEYADRMTKAAKPAEEAAKLLPLSGAGPKKEKHPVYFGFFLLCYAFFQAAYYIPFVNLPNNVVLPPVNGHNLEITGVISALSLGAIAGKFISVLFSSLMRCCLRKTGGAWTPVQHALLMCSVWSGCLAITSGTWLACVDVPGLLWFATFEGVFIGALVITGHMVLFHAEEEWMDSKDLDPAIPTVAWRISSVAVAQGFGQLFTTTLSRWALVSSPGYIYLLLGLTITLWVLYTLLCCLARCGIPRFGSKKPLTT